MSYRDAETLVQQWLIDTPAVADLVRRASDGLPSIYKAMPRAAPLPSIELYRVGGAPPPGSDTPVDLARLAFECWAGDRAAAVAIGQAVVDAVDGLGGSGGWQGPAGRLHAAEVLAVRWLPDPDSDTPRYVVDARFAIDGG